MPKVKVAVIGCGSIAKHRHIPELAVHPQVELSAFCDVVEDRAAAFARQYGGDVYTDYQELLRRSDIDAVVVCTPNVYHAPISVAAAESDKHVLCEKPMATSRDEAMEMVRAAKDRDVVLMIAHNQRLMPPHIKAKEILESGSLGRVLTFRTAFAHGGPEDWSVEGKGGWFFRKEKAFLGALGDLGIHKVDLIRWLLSDEIVQVGAFVGTLNKKDTDVDDNAVFILRTSKGVMGTLAASWTHVPGEDNSTVVYCEKGLIRIGTDREYPLIIERSGGNVEKLRVGPIATNEEGGQTKSGVVDAFMESILNQTPPLISGEEGMKSLSVILAALQSAKENRIFNVG